MTVSPPALAAAFAMLAATSAVDARADSDPAARYTQGVNHRTVVLDGHRRRFIVYVPRRRPPAGGAGVVVMFHGSSGDGEQFLRISGWRELADREGLIAVFPTGLRYRVLDSGRRVTKWNAFGLAGSIDRSEPPPGSSPGAPVPADDVRFVDHVLADVEAQLPVSRRRVYASGFSNGADFAARLAVERSTRIAAVAYAAGGLSEPHRPRRPVPTYQAAGTLDDRLLAKSPEPLDALPLEPGQILASPLLAPNFSAHLETFGLAADDLGVIEAPRSTSLRWPAHGAGADGAVYRFGMAAGVTHQYPNGSNNPAGFRAAPEFWSFFRRHELPADTVTGNDRRSPGVRRR